MTPEPRGGSIQTGGTQCDLATHSIEDLVRPVDDFDPTVIYDSGLFQMMVLLCTHIGAFVLICHNLSIKLLTPPVNHWCKKPSTYENLTTEEWKNISIPLDENGAFSQCMRYEPPLTIFSLNRTLVPCTAWDYDLETYGSTIVSEWDLVCGREYLISVGSSFYMGGAMAAAPVAGLLADKLGRRPVVCYGSVLLLVSGFATCFVESIGPFIICRAIVAASVSAVQIISFVLLFEVCSVRRRALYCTTANLGWVMANLFLKYLTSLKLSRITALVTIMMPSSLLLLTFYMLDESPRWLVATWDLEHAERTIVWASRVNGVSQVEVQEQWAQVTSLLQLQQDRLAYMTKASFFDLFRAASLRQRLVILCWCWFCTIFCYYGFWLNVLVYLSSTVQSVIIVLLPVAFFLSWLAISTYGRRKTLSCCLMLFSLTNSLLASSISEAELSSSASSLLMAAKWFLDACINVLYVYTVELHPTVVRASGMCTAYFAGRVGGALSPFLKELGILHSSMPFAVLTACCLLCALTVLYLPETHEADVPDTIRGMEQNMLRKKLLRIPSTTRKPPR